MTSIVQLIALWRRIPGPCALTAMLGPCKRVVLVGLALWMASMQLALAAADDADLEHLAQQLQQRITLTAAESAWLAGQHTVRFRTAQNPPYHFDLEAPKGISVDYAQVVCKAYRMPCKFVPMIGGTFAESLTLIGNDAGPDVVLSGRRSPERERQALFTREYLFGPQVILTRTDSPVLFGVDELSGKRVLVEKGFLTADKLRAVVSNISFIEVQSTPAALEALASGTGDAYIGELTTTTYLIAQLGLSNLKIAAPTSFPIQGEGMMVRKDWPELVGLIDKAIDAMTVQEKQQLRNRWVSIRYDYGFSRNYAIGFSAVFVVLLAILAAFWRWNRLLQREVAARIRSEERVRQMQAMMERTEHNAHIGSWEWDVGANVVTWSKELYRIFQRDPGLGTLGFAEQLRLYAPESAQALGQAVRAALAHGGVYDLELTGSGEVGMQRIFQATGVGQLGPDGKVARLVGSLQDITQRKNAEAEINSLAFFDSLTGLPNRRAMLERLQRALSVSDRRHRQGALMLIDLDNFKILNDTQGHAIGDQLLVEVALRIKSCIREGDTVARLGGDEFVVILEDLDQGELAAVQVESVATKIQTRINEPYLLHLHEGNAQLQRSHHGSASVGITLFTGAHLSTDELLKRADTAMYQAKAGGRNTLRFFDPAMQAAVTSRAVLEVDLRKALKEEQLVLYYQPQVDDNGQVFGAEALVRWRHPVRGMISPLEFIGLAEDTGLILPLGQWVLEKACQQLRSWAATPDLSALSVAVNVSAHQLRTDNFVDQVLALVDAVGVLPGKLKLELTESSLLENTQDTINKMGALRARGILFSLDDFGTGYSSLSYLKRLPVDQLKIDQSFVRDLLTDPNDAAIARTIVALAHSMGMGVIAEGVETQGQRDFLADSGCAHFQGYLFGKPLPAPDFEALVAATSCG